MVGFFAREAKALAAVVTDLSSKVKDLREQISVLEIEKAQHEESFEKKEREIEHKLGLHRRQVEQDVVLAKREATVSLREENLAADRKRFEEQMAFIEKRFTEQTEYLKGIIGDLAERLPSMKIAARIK